MNVGAGVLVFGQQSYLLHQLYVDVSFIVHGGREQGTLECAHAGKYILPVHRTDENIFEMWYQCITTDAALVELLSFGRAVNLRLLLPAQNHIIHGTSQDVHPVFISQPMETRETAGAWILRNKYKLLEGLSGPDSGWKEMERCISGQDFYSVRNVYTFI